jgi:hypothetical protein
MAIVLSFHSSPQGPRDLFLEAKLEFAMVAKKRPLFRRAPSADWQTDDLHRLWTKTRTTALAPREVSAEAFLDYCRVLCDLRDSFARDDSNSPFEKIFFFLRGGYFAFAYLNQTATLLDRAAIFGGLGHGTGPEQKLKNYLRALVNEAQRNGRASIRLLVIDEVKSGSGVNRILKAVRSVFRQQRGKTAVHCDLTVYAVRPDTEMSPQLELAARTWSEKQGAETVITLTVNHFAGELLGYDDDEMSGIRRTSFGSSAKESYDLVRQSKGVVHFVCKTNNAGIATAGLIKSCLVDTLANTAVALTQETGHSMDTSIRLGVMARGCQVCESHLRSVGRSPAKSGDLR